MSNVQGRWEELPNGSFVYFSDTCPNQVSTGITGRIGDYCVQTTTSGSVITGNIVWVCIASGTPGTWIVGSRGYMEIVIGPLSSSSTSGSLVLPGGIWQIVAARCTATAAGGASGTVTLEWLTGTTASGSGTAQLASAFVIGSTYTPNTVLTGSLIAPPSQMNGATDRLGYLFANTLTGLANLFIAVTLQRMS